MGDSYPCWSPVRSTKIKNIRNNKKRIRGGSIPSNSEGFIPTIRIRFPAFGTFGRTALFVSIPIVVCLPGREVYYCMSQPKESVKRYWSWLKKSNRKNKSRSAMKKVAAKCALPSRFGSWASSCSCFFFGDGADLTYCPSKRWKEVWRKASTGTVGL